MAIMVAVALEAIIIAALVAASLGLGFEDVGTGPDRPPVPMAT